ncbi:hypothetical protein F4819DRAFT_447788 [Hypoxylon fuscum]|nr:hypothetical protein F4819DRAFT_447788 [Hypoxylon fuscum]
MTQLSVSSWLRSALPDKPFIYYDRAPRPRPGRNSIYESLVESIKVEQWNELGTLPDLRHLSLERDRPLDNSLAAAKPITLDAFRVLSSEASLEHFFNHSLIYYINIALHSMYKPPITIVPHVPFRAATLRDDTLRSCENYTPDYTVFKSHIEADTHLLDDHRASLVVGDIKLFEPEGVDNPVDQTASLSWSALGQLLWYCTCRKTRFGFCISNLELVLIEFVIGREETVAALGDAVARAELELSSPAISIPLRAKPPLNKRKYTNSSTTTSTVSPSDRHKQKRNAVPVDLASSDDSPTTLGGLPNSALGQPSHRSTSSSPIQEPQQLEQTSPRTPGLESKHMEYSSSSYMPSSPGDITAETIRDLASAGGDFTARLYSFSLLEREDLPLALFGFIALAQLVDVRGNKNISATPIDIGDYW